MRPFTTIGGVVFLIGAAIHAYRLYAHFPVVIDNYTIPLWFSWGGAVIGTILGVMLLRESQR